MLWFKSPDNRYTVSKIFPPAKQACEKPRELIGLSQVKKDQATYHHVNTAVLDIMMPLESEAPKHVSLAEKVNGLSWTSLPPEPGQTQP